MLASRASLAVAGGQGVPRQVGPGPQRGVARERRGIPLVGPHPLPGQQVVVDGLGEERVAEGVATGVGGHEDVVLDGVADGGVELGPGEVDHAGQQTVGHLAAGSRGEPDHLLAGVVELLEADQEEAREVVGRPGPAQGGRGGELLGEEGVALGALDHRLHLGLAQLAAPQPAHELTHVPVGQGLEVDALDGGQTGPVGQGRAQRVPTVQVVAAVGGDE